MTKQIILASGSPRRSELLRQIGVSFRVEPAHVDESIVPGESPGAYACRVALDKARKAAEKSSDALIIAADTIVVLDGNILGKPADADDATRMLGVLSGKMHIVITGLALIDSGTNQTLTELAETKVWFRKLPPEEIDSYVASGEPLDKAGAYGIQEKGALFVEKIEGCYFNIVGLPLYLLGTMLVRLGVKVL